MGQYYMPLLIGKDKKILRFYSHHYNNGLKLMEHSWVGNNFVNAVLGYIKDNPMRVAWVGDYSDSVENATFGNGFITGRRSFLHYYRKAWSDKSKAPLVDGAELFPLKTNHAAFFLVNTTKSCYIDLQHYVEQNSVFYGNDTEPWCVNPLPLLTCIGNGQGGGDYFEKLGAEDVGAWAFDEIYITEEMPTGMSEETFAFQERW